MSAVSLAIHGGAGPQPTAEADPDFARSVEQGLREALAAGHAVLAAGGPALEACVVAVERLEACEMLNAGRGSALTQDGLVEMDAAVMDGSSGLAGAVAGVQHLASPVRAAVAVLEDGRHVLVSGIGAEHLARARGCAVAEPESFVTARRLAQLERLQQADSGGTVGAVALDAAGGLAAATSTGGTMGKHGGRVSDSCQIGAGTWADARCAVSATGQGEFFIRSAFAHEVAARLRLLELPLDQACRAALDSVAAAGGRGGCIALDRSGQLALPFTTPAMPRAWIGADGVPHLRVA